MKAIEKQENEIKKSKIKKQLIKKSEKEIKISEKLLLKDVIYDEDGILLNWYENYTEKGNILLNNLSNMKRW